MSGPVTLSSLKPETSIDPDRSLSTRVKAQMEEQIALLEGAAFCWLHHPSPLEEYFEASTSAVRSQRIWLEGIICVVIFNLFLIPDFIFSRATLMHSLVVRLGVGTPASIIVLICLRRGVSKAVREGMVVLICAIFGVGGLYLYVGISPVVSSYAVTNLAILILFCNVGIRIRLPYAVFAAAMCFVFGLVFVGTDVMLDIREKFESVGILVAACFLSLVGNYSVERGERLNFLLRLRSEAESGALVEANHHLFALAREDQLTGLPNRGSFEEIYAKVWEESLSTASALSIVMIDIDNFKLLNDTYGHPYGDAVLRRVAALLKQCLRKEGDFVARYGGEEFVVLLPDTDPASVLRVAERIRLLIEVAGSPAVGQKIPDDHGWSTVSCGVSTIYPRMHIDQNQVIEAADKALYEAKAQGRNRVCVGVDVESV